MRVPVADHVTLLPGFAAERAAELLAAIGVIESAAPFRVMMTPGGRPMSAAMTNVGPLGWVSDAKGYRYSPVDPDSGRPWPDMPGPIEALAGEAAAACGFRGFRPDACLVNRYAPGARMAPHQDRDEADFTQPIVSVSLGLPAVFRWCGAARTGGVRVPLSHGDVIVWGGPARLGYHGVAPIRPGAHPGAGPFRYNLTLRKAG